MKGDELLSICCSAPVDGEVIDDNGICSRCKDWAGFVCENCDDDADKCECEDE